MRFSLQVQYAICGVFDLAYNGHGEPVQIRVISERQAIPARYLEQIFGRLRRSEIVASKRGPGGGYTLARTAATITLREVLEAVEGPLEESVAMNDGPPRASTAPTSCGPRSRRGSAMRSTPPRSSTCASTPRAPRCRASRRRADVFHLSPRTERASSRTATSAPNGQATAPPRAAPASVRAVDAGGGADQGRGASAQAAGVFAVFAAAILVHAQTLHYGLLSSWDDPVTSRQPVDPGMVARTPRPCIHGALLQGLPPAPPRVVHGGLRLLGTVAVQLSPALGAARRRQRYPRAARLAQLFGSFPLAFLAALLFAVRPVHVEAVAWVSARKDLLATTFGLLAVSGYDRATGSRSLATRRLSGLARLLHARPALEAQHRGASTFLLAWTGSVRRPGRGLPEDRDREQIPYPLIALGLIWINMLAQPASPADYAHDPLRYLRVKGHAVWELFRAPVR